MAIAEIYVWLPPSRKVHNPLQSVACQHKKDARLRVSINGTLRGAPGPERDADAAHSVIMSFTVCTVHYLLGMSKEGVIGKARSSHGGYLEILPI
jgi:hypothetical protein